ncbi:hypothetical protein Psesu_1154 [Pseudoxanthomonas suwonensis 11-1]|uniref:Uncharacterized protein n=1 Tax=Pseudoxanthomonas suwonensis (strain 11-1) TaxID=743721 RepID=E6WS55_PSEUU|nr:hypothetical protein [Pseudoxanthomonas suwonensis]ADV27004.1 hypothetical protein Psesu_1154 [Pseudoxanthomonas suwonensis 11-1]
MANVRELLGRLNQQTIRYDVGRGGIAELTNQDIAAALAFVEPGLGRELLEACWWPDGAALRRKQLRDQVLALVQPELRRQCRALEEARIDVGIAKACIGWGGAATAEQARELERATARLERAAAECWPRTTLESLPTLAQAVIREIAHPNLCSDCEGRGHRVAGELVVACIACSGHGITPMSDRKRAAAIGRDESTYRQTWRGVYQWLLVRMRDAESQAAAQLAAALSRAA